MSEHSPRAVATNAATAPQKGNAKAQATVLSSAPVDSVHIKSPFLLCSRPTDPGSGPQCQLNSSTMLLLLLLLHDPQQN